MCADVRPAADNQRDEGLSHVRLTAINRHAGPDLRGQLYIQQPILLRPLGYFSVVLRAHALDAPFDRHPESLTQYAANDIGPRYARTCWRLRYRMVVGRPD